MEDRSNAQKIKIILLGDSSVGKTSLIHQYVNKKFQKSSAPKFTDPLSKDTEVQGKHIILEIHDTSGREHQGAGGLEASFFNNAKACMFVYDVHDLKSLENLENWYNEFRTKVISEPSKLEGFPFVVLGNKADQDNGKETFREKAIKWCQEKNIEHFSTSAKDNKHVNEAFKFLAELVVKYQLPPRQGTTNNPQYEKPLNEKTNNKPQDPKPPIGTTPPKLSPPPPPPPPQRPTKPKKKGCCTIL